MSSGAKPEQGYGERFRTRKFADGAAEVIRQLILSRQVKPGERLNEVALSQMFEISRSPIREALNVLAGEGLVEFVPGRGAYVPKFSLEKINYLAEVRQALECLGARLAAGRANPDQLLSLERSIEKSEMCLATDPGVYPTEPDFHAQVLIASGNPCLLQTASSVITQLRLARFWSAQAPGRAEQACREHRAIHEALAGRDPQAADAAMRDHLINAARSAGSQVTSSKRKKRA